jgi:hypothetical protein
MPVRSESESRPKRRRAPPIRHDRDRRQRVHSPFCANFPGVRAYQVSGRRRRVTPPESEGGAARAVTLGLPLLNRDSPREPDPPGLGSVPMA